MGDHPRKSDGRRPAHVGRNPAAADMYQLTITLLGIEPRIWRRLWGWGVDARPTALRVLTFAQ